MPGRISIFLLLALLGAAPCCAQGMKTIEKEEYDEAMENADADGRVEGGGEESGGGRRDGEERENGGGEEGGGESRGGTKLNFNQAAARAEKFVAQKKYSQALKVYMWSSTAMSSEDQRKIYVYERMGWLSLKRGDTEEALSYYLTAIGLAERLEIFNKFAVNSYRGAAYCYEQGGDAAAAAENYRAALKLTKDKAARRDIEKRLKKLGGRKR